MVSYTTDLFVSSISFSVIKIKRVDALPILRKHHYLGGVGLSAMIYGLFEYGELKGLVSYQTPVSENVRSSVFGVSHKDNVTELSRLCLLPSCTTPASQFVSESLKVMGSERSRRGMSPILGIISFADTSQGHHGGVYQSMSWLFCGTSTTKIDQYVDQDGVVRHRRQCGVNITKEQALEKGWTVRKAEAFVVKNRYIKILGSSKVKKRMRSKLILDVFPYPKPNNN